MISDSNIIILVECAVARNKANIVLKFTVLDILETTHESITIYNITVSFLTYPRKHGISWIRNIKNSGFHFLREVS